MIKPDKELVVILHGIGMSPLRMAFLDLGLKRAGYRTFNIGYPSLRKSIEDCAAFVQEKIDRLLQNNRPPKIHFVAHSMGSLVTLELLSRKSFANPGRAVLIAPPYGGSEVADLLQNWKIFRTFFGPAGQQLTTAYRKTLEQKLPEGLEIGVIAGTRAYEYPLFLSTMKHTGVHDGLVSVKSTHIPAMKDHITIRMSHSFLLEKSLSQTVHFLGHGEFKRDKEAPAPSLQK